MDAVLAFFAPLFGSGAPLGAPQMAARAAAAFFIALALIRIAGRRSFGQRSPFDYVVGILLGATLSRAIVGVSPFWPTVAASLAIVLLHRALAWACMRSARLERFFVGAQRELYRNGRFDEAQMSAALITMTDIYESVRQKTGECDLSGVAAAILERNGHVSIIRRKS